MKMFSLPDGRYENMMARLVHNLVVSSATILAAIAVVVVAQAERGPRIELSTQDLNLGHGLPNERMRGTFLIRNDGGAPLQFTLHPSCGCTSVRPLEGSIDPGGKQEIEVVLSLPAIAAAEKSARIEVRSNDTELPTVACRVQGKSSTPIQCAPAYVNFRKPASGDPRGGVVTVAVLDAEGGPVTELQRITATSGSSAFTVQPQLDQLGNVVVRVGVLTSKLVQRISTKIEIADSKSGYRLAIPVSAELEPEFRVVPSTVLFSVDPVTGQSRDKRILVWASNQETPIGKFISYDAPDGVAVNEIEQTGTHDRRKQLAIKLTKPIAAGTRGKVKMIFADVKELVVEYRVSE